MQKPSFRFNKMADEVIAETFLFFSEKSALLALLEPYKYLETLSCRESSFVLIWLHGYLSPISEENGRRILSFSSLPSQAPRKAPLIARTLSPRIYSETEHAGRPKSLQGQVLHYGIQ